MKTEIGYYKLPLELEKKTDSLVKNLDRDSTEFNKRDARKIAGDYALQNVPAQSDTSLEPFIEEIRGFYMRKNTDIAIQLQGAIQEELATMNIHTAREEVESCMRESKKLADENRRDQADLENLESEVDRHKTKKFDRILTVLGITEAVGYTLSYLRLGDSWLLALVWGLLLGFSTTWGVKLFVLYLRDRQKGNISAPVRIAIIVVFALILLALATLRFWSMQGGSSAFAHSPLALLVFMMVTLLLTGVVAAFTYIYYPNKEQERIIQEQNELDRKIKERKARIVALEERISKFKNDLNAVSQMHKRMHTITLDMHKRMQAFFREAMGVFKRENIVKRTDDVNPTCFSRPVAPLQLNDELIEQPIPEIEEV